LDQILDTKMRNLRKYGKFKSLDTLNGIEIKLQDIILTGYYKETPSTDLNERFLDAL
jgi:hypothetical protein